MSSSAEGDRDVKPRRRAYTGGVSLGGSRRAPERDGRSSELPFAAEEKQHQEDAAFWNIKDEHIIPEPIRSHFMPPRKCKEWKSFVFRHLPILALFWTYRLKFIIGDLIAGITIGVTHIPQGIGFALLANLPVVYGLYSSFVPPLIYTVLGTSRHISVGTFPVVSLMVGEAVERLTDGCTQPNEGTFNSTLFGREVECSVVAQSTAVTLALLVGIIMIVFGILQLGCITLFLSDALVSGYTCAAAFTILITQIRAILGLPRDIHPGEFQNIRRLLLYFHDFVLEGQHNNAAIVFALISIIFLVSMDYFNKFLNKYLRLKLKGIPVIIPAQLVVVIVATGISFGIRPPGPDIVGAFNMSITGEILQGAPPPTFEFLRLSLFPELITDAIVISIISYVINISQAKLFAKKSKYTIDSNQEFLAYGFMNLFGSFFGSFATAGALSRTVLQHTLGGNTQLVSILSSIVVLIVLVGLTFLFTYLPIAALAAIIATALLGLYLQIFDLKKFFKLSFLDGCVWIVVFTATFIIGLGFGLLIGVAFSLVFVIVYTILPSSGALGLADDWNPQEWRFTKVSPIKGIFIFRFEAPLYFINAAVFRAQLAASSGVNPAAHKEEEEGGFSVCFKKCQKNDAVYDTEERDQEVSSNSVATSETTNAPVQPVDMRYISESTVPVQPVDMRYISESGQIKPLSRSSTPRPTADSQPLRNTGISLQPVSETTSQTTSQTTLETAPQTTPETTSQTTSQTTPETAPQTAPETTSQTTPETNSLHVEEAPNSRDEENPQLSQESRSKFLPKVGIHNQQGYLAARYEYSQMSDEWKSNIATHGHVLKYHTIIIDCSPVLFVDATGVEMLYQLIKDYDEIRVQVLLARPNSYLLQLLKRVGFFDAFGSSWIFPSLSEAVQFAKSGKRVRHQFVQESLDLLFMMYWEKQAYKGERFDPVNTVQQLTRRLTNPNDMHQPSPTSISTSPPRLPLGSETQI